MAEQTEASQARPHVTVGGVEVDLAARGPVSPLAGPATHQVTVERPMRVQHRPRRDPEADLQVRNRIIFGTLILICLGVFLGVALETRLRRRRT